MHNEPRSSCLLCVNVSYSILVAYTDQGLVNGTSSALHVESNNVRSVAKEYLRLDSSGAVQTVFPLMTAIISVDKGTVTGITWDDGCFFCDPAGSSCDENTFVNGTTLVGSSFSGKTCQAPLSECSGSSCNGCCDMKLYVVWTGSDANGHKFLSAGSRFSRFQSYKLSSLYNSARKFIA